MKRIIILSLVFLSSLAVAQTGFVNGSAYRGQLQDSAKLSFPSGYLVLYPATWKNQWWISEDGGVTKRRAFPGLFSSTARGLTPASGGGTTNYLRADGSFANPTTGYALTTYVDTHLAGQTFTNSASNGDVPTFNGTNWTFAAPAGGVSGSGTTNELAYFTGASTIASLTTATYPSLTELGYVKGLTSGAQSQINGKQATLVSATNIKTVNGNTLLGSGDVSISTGLTVGTTAITSGTDTRILYDNGGVLGEYPMGTGVATALSVNTGSAGAVVLFNGAYGTPASLTLTNATGLNANTGLTGTTLNSSVVTSSLTSLGTIATGVWNGTVIANTYGGTGQNSSASTGIAQVSSGTWSFSTALANGTTGTTQSRNDNSTKLATTAYADAAAGSSTFYGSIYSATSFSSLTGFTDNTSGGAAVSGGTINFSGGSNTLTKTLDYDYHTSLEKWKQEATFTASEKNGTSYGFGLGLNGQAASGTNNEVFAWFDMTSGANAGKILLKTGSDVTLSTSAAISFSVNDQIILTLERHYNRYIATAMNLTTSSAIVSVEYQIHINASAALPPTIAKFCVMSRGGAFKLTAYSIYTTEIKNGLIAVVSDSKGVGFSTSELKSRFASLLSNYYSGVLVLGSPGDRTADLLNRVTEVTNMAPKYVLLAIGCNDIRASISSGTYQSNYASIVSSFQAAGITVIHLLPFRETGIDVTPLRDWIISNYGSSYINTYPIATTMLAADNIHLNDEGNAWAFSKIVNSGLLNLPTVNIPGFDTEHLTIANATSDSQLRIGTSKASNDGGYLTSTSSSNLLFSAGAELVNGAWIARSTTASFVSLSGNSVLFYANGSLTPGSTFAPTQTLSSDVSVTSLTGGLKVQGGFTGGNGAGAEVQLSGGIAYFLGYNRSSSTFLQVIVSGSTVDLQASGVSILNIGSTGATVGDAKNFIFNTSTGSKLGTATTQKWAAWGATPIVQPGATTDLGTVLSDIGLRAVGTAYPITTSANVKAGNNISSFTTTATAAGTTTLTVSSNYFQTFTGATTQTVTLPVVTTLTNGHAFRIVNNSSGVVTVQTSGSNSIKALAGGSYLDVWVVDTTGGTGTASWNWIYTASINN